MYNMFVNTVLPSPNETGCYYSPTIIEVNPSMTIWKEEVKKIHIASAAHVVVD